MKKLILILILALFLTGCTQISQFSGGPSSISKKGTEGIEITLSNIPNEMYEQDVSAFNVKIENKGFADIGDGIIKLSVEQDFLDIENNRKEFELIGKSGTLNSGESDYVYFMVEAKNLDETSIERETDFHITSCYDYYTDFSQDVCIDSDIYNTNQNKVCSPQKISLSGGQGGPVTITNIESRMILSGSTEKMLPSFTLTIKNKGDGTVIKKNKIDEICSSEGIDNNDFNIIHLKVEMLENGRLVSLECSQNMVKLRDNEKVITCTYSPGFDLDVGTYMTPLHIRMDYGYSEVISDSITIKNSEV